MPPAQPLTTDSSLFDIFIVDYYHYVKAKKVVFVSLTPSYKGFETTEIFVFLTLELSHFFTLELYHGIETLFIDFLV